MKQALILNFHNCPRISLECDHIKEVYDLKILTTFQKEKRNLLGTNTLTEFLKKKIF